MKFVSHGAEVTGDKVLLTIINYVETTRSKRLVAKTGVFSGKLNSFVFDLIHCVKSGSAAGLV